MRKNTYLILHNIRSTYNVGAIFRTADAAGVAKIYLCGITPTPQPSATNHPLSINGKIAKTALGAEKTVPWEYCGQTSRLVRKLKLQNSNLKIVALEQTKSAENIFSYKPPKNKDIALVVGNEISGLNKKILSCTDKIVEIPMHGKKESLNVAVATGIALYKIKTNF